MFEISRFLIVIALFAPFVTLPFKKHLIYLVIISILAIYDFGFFGNLSVEGLSESLFISILSYIVLGIVTDLYQPSFFKTLLFLLIAFSVIAKSLLLEFIINPSLSHAIVMLCIVITVYYFLFKSKVSSR